MSDFPGPIQELLHVSVDNFQLHVGLKNGRTNKDSTCFFLSHCHTDHMRGLLDEPFISHMREHPHCKIYCSSVSRLILSTYRALHPLMDRVIELRIGHSKVRVPSSCNGLDYDVSVTCIPAGHCPGSVMFLFETHLKVLYTGDFRFFTGDTAKMPYFHDKLLALVKPIDKIYLDATFFHESFHQFLNRNRSIDIIVDKAQQWLHADPLNQVELNMPANYGGECIIDRVANALKCKVHVLAGFYDMYQRVPEVKDSLTDNCRSTRVHSQTRARNKDCLVGVPRHRILSIQPKAAPFKCYKPNAPTEFKQVSVNRIDVNYSSHSSYSEIIDFLTHLKPKEVHLSTSIYDNTVEKANEEIDNLIYSWGSHGNITPSIRASLSSPTKKRHKPNEPFVPVRLCVSHVTSIVSDSDLD